MAEGLSKLKCSTAFNAASSKRFLHINEKLMVDLIDWEK
jgi:hypothetical protein